jgi:hypothetical protein
MLSIILVGFKGLKNLPTLPRFVVGCLVARGFNAVGPAFCRFLMMPLVVSMAGVNDD